METTDGMFSVVKAVKTHAALGARQARLALPGRRLIETPHYLGNTSRGVVPHISQDTFSRDTSISGVYVALEDFVERLPNDIPPLYRFAEKYRQDALRRFIALPDETVLAVGVKRTPPVAAPPAVSNTNTAVSVCTSVGFRYIKAEGYSENTEKLNPDIIIALGDVPHGRALGSKRIEKATDRSIQWIQDHVRLRKRRQEETEKPTASKLFASLLPVSCANQQFLIECLADELREDISGLSVYNTDTLEDLPESIQHLPRLALTEPASPHDILQQVAGGVDIFVIPFIGAATDAGIALDFAFPPIDEPATTPASLGVDMWSVEHATDLSPLTTGCTCYACTGHHRAYLQHLLAAKEMLGWVLLQIHNHHILDSFFAGIRRSIAADTFQEDVATFARVYESQLPAKTGQGPRVRGYQFKTDGPGEAKKNALAFTSLNDNENKLAEATLPDPTTDATDLEQQGFAERT